MRSKKNIAPWFISSMFFCHVLVTSALADVLLTGTVVDDANSSPIAKATVTLRGAAVSSLTDNQGKFTVQNDEWPKGSGRTRSHIADFVF